MSLLSWPSKKNLLKVVAALEELEASNPQFIRPVHLANALHISQREAKFILETAERSNSIKSFYSVTCPKCRAPYNVYESMLDIPDTTDHCDNCHSENEKIRDFNIEKVYKIQ